MENTVKYEVSETNRKKKLSLKKVKNQFFILKG